MTLIKIIRLRIRIKYYDNDYNKINNNNNKSNKLLQVLVQKYLQHEQKTL